MTALLVLLAQMTTASGGLGSQRRTNARRARAAVTSFLDQRGATWAGYLLLPLVVFALVVANAPGQYIGDFRVEFIFSPGRFLARNGDLWNDLGGLGSAGRTEGTPLPTLFTTVIRGFGAEPWLAQRIWHATLMSLGGLGVMTLLRIWRRQMGVWHVAAGLAYAVNPLSLILLIPSGIYMSYALFPWMLTAIILGAKRDRWKWAAVFTLCVVCVAPTQVPSLTYAFAYVGIGVLAVLLQGDITWRGLWSWSWRTMLLGLGTLSFIIFRTVLAREALAGRLASTESPASISGASSFSEVIRGLGHWLVYFRESSGATRPHQAGYLDSLPMVLATYALPAIALIGAARSRWRARQTFIILFAVSCVVMVGIFDRPDPTGWGRLLSAAYDNVPATQALRNTMKGGLGWALGVSVLFGLAAQHLRDSGRSSWVRSAAAIAMAATLIGVSAPLWTGNLYSPSNRSGDRPSYWVDAIDWLNDTDHRDRVLILPGTSSTIYRWGSLGDDQFNAMLDKPFIRDTPFFQNTARTEDLISWLDVGLSSGSNDDVPVGDLLRRLGVRYVLIRNDLDWRKTTKPRPAQFDDLRTNDDLRLVATFGESGQNTTGSFDTSVDAAAERMLPPVEIYEVVGDQLISSMHLAATLGTVVAGDGAAFLQLADAGLLKDDGQVRFSSDLSDDELAAAIDQGQRVVVTDTNVRRESLVTATNILFGAPLAEREPGDAERALFDRPGATTFAWYPNARSITASNPSVGTPQYRAANAFDGDPETSWLTGPLSTPAGRSIAVDFATPTEVSSIRLTAAGAPAAISVVTGTVSLSDGSIRQFRMAFGEAELLIPPTETSFVVVTIEAVSRQGLGRGGFAEIEIDDLDLTEHRQVPSTIIDRLEALDLEPTERADLELSYLFRREGGLGDREIERRLARRFDVDATRSFRATGRLVIVDDERRAGLLVDAATAPDDTCWLPAFELDGQTVSVAVDDREALVSGDAVRYRTCDDLTLDAGGHLIASTDATQLETVELHTPAVEGEPQTAPTGSISIDQTVGRTTRAAVELETEALLVSGVAYDPNWTASANGRDLGPPTIVDTQAAWLLPPGASEIEITYGLQDQYELVLLASIACIALCCGLAVRRSEVDA